MTRNHADVEGFGYGEIAQIMSIPVGTVGSRLHRGRASTGPGRPLEARAQAGIPPPDPEISR